MTSVLLLYKLPANSTGVWALRFVGNYSATSLCSLHLLAFVQGHWPHCLKLTSGTTKANRSGEFFNLQDWYIRACRASIKMHKVCMTTEHLPQHEMSYVLHTKHFFGTRQVKFRSDEEVARLSQMQSAQLIFPLSGKSFDLCERINVDRPHQLQCVQCLLWAHKAMRKPFALLEILVICLGIPGRQQRRRNNPRVSGMQPCSIFLAFARVFQESNQARLCGWSVYLQVMFASFDIL